MPKTKRSFSVSNKLAIINNADQYIVTQKLLKTTCDFFASQSLLHMLTMFFQIRNLLYFGKPVN